MASEIASLGRTSPVSETDIRPEVTRAASVRMGGEPLYAFDQRSNEPAETIDSMTMASDSAFGLYEGETSQIQISAGTFTVTL